MAYKGPEVEMVVDYKGTGYIKVNGQDINASNVLISVDAQRGTTVWIGLPPSNIDLNGVATQICPMPAHFLDLFNRKERDFVPTYRDVEAKEFYENMPWPLVVGSFAAMRLMTAVIPAQKLGDHVHRLLKMQEWLFENGVTEKDIDDATKEIAGDVNLWKGRNLEYLVIGATAAQYSPYISSSGADQPWAGADRTRSGADRTRSGADPNDSQ